MAGTSPDGMGPPPQFHFRVTLFDDVAVPFQEVVGMEGAPPGAPPTIEYPQGSGAAFAPMQMPALGREANVTLRRGVFVNDARFWSWVSQIRMNTVAPGTVTIVMLDQAAAPRMTWTLTNARPTRIVGADPEPTGSEVAVESLEIVYETQAAATP